MSTFDLVACIILTLFTIFGLFGNTNILIATARKRAFKNKSGIIICAVAFYDNISLICALSIVVRTIQGVVIKQHECFKTMGFCFGVQILSICALLTLALDRLVAVSFPYWYTTVKTWVPLVFATAMGLALCAIFAILSFINMGPDHDIPVCSEGTALPRSVQKYGNILFFIINGAIVATYLLAYAVLFWRSKAHRNDVAVSATLRTHTKAMNSIAFFVFVFCFSWFLSQILASILRNTESRTSPIVFAMKLIMICSISFSYSHCYYVYFWTSKDYRAAFLEQLRCASVMKVIACCEMNTFDIIACSILAVFAVFGLFGNTNILIATARKRAFRNKTGIIICAVALYDNISLLCSLSIIIRTIQGAVIRQHECFKTMGFCFGVQILSICALLTLTLDRLVAVSLPYWYTTVKTWTPIAFASALGASLIAVFATLSFTNMEPDHDIPVCSEGTSLPRSLRWYSNILFFIINGAIIAIYLLAYAILFWRKAHRNDVAVSATLRTHTKAMNSIAFFVFVFCFSWFLSQILASILRNTESRTSPLVFAMKMIMICSISFSYSHCYYVYFWTSKDYRAAFLEQLRCASGAKLFVTSKVVFTSKSFVRTV